MGFKTTTHTTRRLTIEGKHYDSVDQVPLEVRDRYKVLFEMLAQDDDRDGVPDLFQDGPGYTVSESEPVIVTTRTQTMRFTMDDDNNSPTPVIQHESAWRGRIWILLLALALLAIWAFFGMETGYLRPDQAP
ncbi:MAG: hypothetical protein KJ667_08110 [Alphaproteobacteria bacterium]|nr:hypothetical protein [Alphaproteobacteria bacterium]